VHTLLKVVNLKKYFIEKAPLTRALRRLLSESSSLVKEEYVRAVDGVSFQIQEKETFGLVGESGCGKSTLARCIVGLEKPTSGDVHFLGQNITKLKENELREIRRHISIVFQDVSGALNPRKKIEDIIASPLKTYKIVDSTLVRQEVTRLLDEVGLSPDIMRKYPHELSGGMKQRVNIARALATRPKLIILDEPTSALDISVAAKILNMLKDLQEKRGCSYMLISHDLNIVRFLSSQIGVMYLGKIVELGEGMKVFSRRLHPYTKCLFSASPIPDPRAKEERIPLRGEPVGTTHLPKGCRFINRCPLFYDLGRPKICGEVEPELTELYPEHKVACHFAKNALTFPHQ